MIRAHKIRLNPTIEQEIYFRKACGVARFTFNWGLARWKELYEAGEKPSALSLKTEFNAIKKAQFPWVYEVTKCAAEQAFAHLGQAFAHFFRRLKNGEKEVGYPKFKSKRYHKQSFYLANDKIAFDGNWVNIPKLGWVNMAEPLRFAGKVMGATVSSQAGKWYISVSVEIEHQHEWNGKPDVGIDLGISQLITLSGERGYFENQKVLRQHLRKLASLNRQLARRQQGSKRWWKAKNQLARLHARIRNQRQDYLHKITTNLANNFQVIGMESLNTKGMLRNHKLALSLSDVAFSEVGRQLEYKTVLYGGLLQRVDPFFPSSKRCSRCGWVNKELTLSDRVFSCLSCGHTQNRDSNAADNIEAEALRLACLPANKSRGELSSPAGSGYVGVTLVDCSMSGMKRVQVPFAYICIWKR